MAIASRSQSGHPSHNQDTHPAKVAHLASWPDSTMFSSAEQVVLTYCEGLMDCDLAGFAPFHQAITEHFSETEMVDIAAIVINMNLWTRLKLAQGTTPSQED